LQRERRLTDLTGPDGTGLGWTAAAERHTHTDTAGHQVSRPKEQRANGSPPATSQCRASHGPAPATPATPPWPAAPAARLQCLASGGPQRGGRGGPNGCTPAASPARRQTPDAFQSQLQFHDGRGNGLGMQQYPTCNINIPSASRRSILPDDAWTGLD
jgi:hypothetical protein